MPRDPRRHGAGLRVAVVADLAEERWPSMDLVADMLTAHLSSRHVSLSAELIRPSLANMARLGASGMPSTFERFKNRFWDYPRWLRAHTAHFDIFHVVDHSYAHLVHVLPAESTVVTCHDVDAFLPLVRPDLATSQLPKWLTRRVLTGLQRARAVVCVSHATRDDLVRHGLVPADRISVAHNGVDERFSPAATGDDETIRELIEERRGTSRQAGETLDLLHVGSCIPRKRIDRLLEVFAAVRSVEPRARLIKAGGHLTTEQWSTARRLAVDPHIVQLPFLDTLEMAALYRRARTVVVTSEREGFGLPIIESMACGTPVVATSLPVLREVGGSAVAYCDLDNIGQWRDAILQNLRADSEAGAERREACIKQASRFTWRANADAMVSLYQDVWRARAA